MRWRRRRRLAVSADPDAIGPDGVVRLRAYLPHETVFWFAATCTGCGREAPIGVRPAIALMGSGDATVGQLERRLRGTGCGGRRVLIRVAADPRPAEVMRRDGPLPQTRADPRRQR
jgi:hypothetical protein